VKKCDASFVVLLETLAQQVILDLAQDTKEGRQRALQLKALKEQQARDKANTLKEAYLKKQLGKAMWAAKKGKGEVDHSNASASK